MDDIEKMKSILERTFSLEGKTALVTGASSGIGRVLAIGFAEAGARVGVNGVDATRLEATRKAIENAGGEAVALPADLSTPQACHALVTAAHDLLRRIDILVNCAGTNRRKPIEEVTPEDFERIVSVNLQSVYFLSQAVYPIMRAQGGGKIINIGSLTSTVGLAGVSVYGATKAAVAQLTRTMALEWAPANIQVNCLAPGFFMTPLTEVGLWGDPHKKQWILERVPAKRPGQPEELLGTALLLASNGSSFLTGQMISVDGGFLAGGSWL